MALQLVEYVRKPFVVRAVRVTAENINDVARWCKGTVIQEGEVFYIKVDVQRPLDERQTQAYFGDYVLAAGRSFKVYTEFAFNKSFVPNTGVDKKPTRKKSPAVHTPQTEALNAMAPVQDDIHPSQLALVQFTDHGLPEEPAEMRETRVSVTPTYPL